MLKLRLSSRALLLSALVTTACAEDPTRLSLSGPSPVGTAAASPSGVNSSSGIDADLSGGAVQDPGVIAEWAASRGWAAAADGLEVEGTDTITAVSGLCPAVVITVRGVPVTVTGSTAYTGGTTCAALVAGARVHVRGVLSVAGGVLSVVATRLGVDSAPGPTPGPGTRVEVEGTVAGTTGACPALTITLQGTAGVVVTSATTVFDPTGSCGLIAVGKKIEAVGTRNAAHQLVAAKVEVDDDDGEGGGGGGGEKKKVNGEGTIGAITGACPTLTMVITGARVQTTAATEYINGGCATLRSGTKVKVHAETQPDGRILAERVETLRAPGRSISGDGEVSRVSGACPVLTMTVRGYPVRTSATTTFTGGTCESIRPGTKIDVTGTADDTGVDATKVEIKR